jgi:hypothetical protein
MKELPTQAPTEFNQARAAKRTRERMRKFPLAEWKLSELKQAKRTLVRQDLLDKQFAAYGDTLTCTCQSCKKKTVIWVGDGRHYLIGEPTAFKAVLTAAKAKGWNRTMPLPTGTAAKISLHETCRLLPEVIVPEDRWTENNRDAPEEGVHDPSMGGTFAYALGHPFILNNCEDHALLNQVITYQLTVLGRGDLVPYYKQQALSTKSTWAVGVLQGELHEP